MCMESMGPRLLLIFPHLFKNLAEQLQNPSTRLEQQAWIAITRDTLEERLENLLELTQDSRKPSRKSVSYVALPE